MDKLTRMEILNKVAELEFEKRCIAVNVCPKCGTDLVILRDIDEPEGSTLIQEKYCIPCKLHWPST